MEQNKVRSYFLYAIGEIALVMIGILLALQVNNWNEEKKTRDREKILVTNLKNAVTKAGEVADDFIVAEESNITILGIVLQNWSDLSYSDIENQFRPFQNNNFSPLFNLSAYSQFYDPGMDVYNTAVNDGSISIIQDVRLVQVMDGLFNYVVPRVNELMAEEYLLGRSINDHIAVHYKKQFLNGSVSDSIQIRPNLWTEDTYRKLFLEMRNDGVLKYKLAQRLELKRTRLLLILQAKYMIEPIISEE